MKAHYDIIQGGEAWLRLRWGKIGGTLSSGLLVDSDTLLIEVVAMMLEEFELDENDFQSPQMLRGNELEPEARKHLILNSGIDFLECGWLESETIPMLGISPDGISADFKKACEIKCPARKKHTETVLADVIPADNIKQCVHYFTVNSKLEELYFVSFRPESKYPFFLKKMIRTDEINLGTKAKPIVKTVDEWCKIIRQRAKDLHEDITNAVSNLELKEKAKKAF